MSDLPDWANTLAIPAVTSAIVAYVVTLAKTQGEIKKLRHEQRTAHFSHRQGCYHDLLNAERRGQKGPRRIQRRGPERHGSSEPRLAVAPTT